MGGLRLTEYDGIILAAGRNTRLRGVVPSFYKPLVIVNGRPLIVNLVNDLLDRCEHVVVTVSPENCGPIADVLQANELYTHAVTLLVQGEARGPGESLYRALRAAKSERIILACGDNVIPERDLDAAIQADDDDHFTVLAATTKIYDETAAARFTRVLNNEFIEQRPGGYDENLRCFRCWVGPLVFNRVTAETLFEHAIAAQVCSSDGDEVKISPIFNRLPGLKIVTVEGSSLDIGTSGALLQLGENVG